MIVEEMSKFAEGALVPLNETADAEGCKHTGLENPNTGSPCRNELVDAGGVAPSRSTNIHQYLAAGPLSLSLSLSISLSLSLVLSLVLFLLPSRVDKGCKCTCL